MKAAWYDDRGPARDVLQVGDLPKPSVQAGEVLVRIHASGINPSDTKSRSGAGARPNVFPRVIPHQDGAGVIEAVGEGVDAGRIGQRVWVYEAQLGRPFGCAADYTSVPAINAVALPATTSFEEGACLGVPALTAHYCVTADGPLEGKFVLVTGGAGAVGFYAVQFARHEGATVIATVRTEEQARVAREAGAQHILYRLKDDMVAGIARITGVEDGRGIDRIVDVAFGANLDTSLKVLKTNGSIASYASDQTPVPALPFWQLIRLNATVRYVLVYAMSREAHAKAIAAVTDALAKRTLKHHIAARFALDRIIDAHEALESGQTVGKIIIAMDAN
ncbi:NADPH:quinone reductase [Paralcaligenes sp. KSB-10]|uniref:NADPH:quinone reductase n=1 Tax=Paralcaligenes sp. KSB-10 TaxID=2901142 RepID=UPI001E4C95EF|nr:NADPH:quinone reductase [Paralcaligenes sp. KSB-10]UHL65628.1 NADPH:quinone reductase [Paralcaligenes sp. KSB-10]